MLVAAGIVVADEGCVLDQEASGPSLESPNVELVSDREDSRASVEEQSLQT